MNQVIPTTPNKTLWEQKAPAAQRNLILKVLAVALITLVNLAGIAVGFTYMCMYFPIATQPLLVSPIIVGVLGALSFLKIPTFGVNSFNYKDYSNPAIMSARAVTYVLFGPVVLTVRWLDWTNYSDHFVAKRISDDFKSKEYEEILSLHGPRAKNLGRYGYLTPELAKTFEGLYKKAKAHLEAKKFLEAEKASDVHDFKDLANIKTEWESLKGQISADSNCFDIPKPQAPDFSKKSTKIKLFARKHLNLYAF